MSSKSFVITGLYAWDGSGSEPAQALANELSHTYDVLYVNPPSELASLLRERSQRDTSRKKRALYGNRSAIRHLTERLWILDPPILLSTATKIYSDAVFDFLNRRNSLRFGATIRWAIEYIGLENLHLIICNDFFRSFYLDEVLLPEKMLYYRTCNLSDFPHWHYHGRRLEPLLTGRCDAAVASSQQLAEDIRPYNANTFNIGQGNDITGCHFTRIYKLPSDLRGIRHPIIGCVEAPDTPRLSPSLLAYIASSFPNCSLVVIGLKDDPAVHHWLHRLHNVYLLDAKPTDLLPHYIAAFDICIAPEEIDDRFAASYNPHIARYLALGKRVIASATDAMAPFLHHLPLAANREEFVRQTYQSLILPVAPDEAEKRHLFASSLSWKTCVERLLSVLELLDEQQGERCGNEPETFERERLCN